MHANINSMQESRFIHFEKMGNGPPLLFLHGLFGSGQNWRGIANVFSDRYSCYLLDARNHGNSFWNSSHCYTDLAEDLIHFIEKENLKNCSLLGHSMGGKTLYALSKFQHSSVKAFGVFDILPIQYENQHQQILEILCKLDPHTFKNRMQIVQYLTEKLGNTSLAQFLAKNFLQKANGWQVKANFQAFQANIDNICEAIHLNTCKIPLLAIFGGNSYYYQKDKLDILYQKFPHLELKVMPNKGHWLHAEAPENFCNILDSFLSSIYS